MALLRAHARTAQALTAILLFCSAGQAEEIIVPTQMPLSVALASAAPGTTITLLPAGSPYQTFPGFSFSGKHLTIRGFTGNPADVVIDGVGLDRVLMISNTASSGMVYLQNLTLANGQGPSSANAFGGGLHLNNVNITIDNCIIRDNTLPSTNGGGGGMYGKGSTLIVRNTVFESNAIGSTGGDGGAVFLDDGSALFEDCRFTANIATEIQGSTGAVGGAVYGKSGSFIFTRCTFDGNEADMGGAAYFSEGAVSILEACSIMNNTASHVGALFFTSSAESATVRNSLIIHNEVLGDLSVLRADSPTHIINCTIAENIGGNRLMIGGAVGTNVKLDNCIIWGNTAALISSVGSPNAPLIRRSIVQVAYTPNNASAHNIVADPLFVSAAAGDFRLQAGSPAIDAGDTGLYFGPFADFDGNVRGVAASSSPTGRSLAGPIIDMGAFEFFVEPCYANCTGATSEPFLTVDDFTCFINRFAQGCP